MTAINAAAVAWAVQIPGRGEISGPFMHVAARAETDNVTRRSMATLCYELQSDPSTVRRVLAYLESVGAIVRETRGGGPGALQEIRLCVDTPPATIFRAMQATPYRPNAKAKPAATRAPVSAISHAPVSELGPKPAHTTIAPVNGLAKPAHTTRAQDPRTDARVQLANSPVPSTPVVVNGSLKEGINSGVGDTGARAHTHEEDAPPPPAKVMLPTFVRLTEQDMADLAQMFRHKEPDGEAGVRRVLTEEFQTMEVDRRWRRANPRQAAYTYLTTRYEDAQPLPLSDHQRAGLIQEFIGDPEFNGEKDISERITKWLGCDGAQKFKRDPVSYVRSGLKNDREYIRLQRERLGPRATPAAAPDAEPKPVSEFARFNRGHRW